MQPLLFCAEHTFQCSPLPLVKKTNLSPFGQRGILYSSPYAMSLDGRLVWSLVSGVFGFPRFIFNFFVLAVLGFFRAVSVLRATATSPVGFVVQ